MKLGAQLLLAFVTTAISSHAWGQAIAYDHRSTAEGDVRSAMADQQQAWGASARNWAEGYSLYVNGEQMRVMLDYEVYRIRQQVAADRRTAIQRKAQDRRERLAQTASDVDRAARRLVNDFQVGAYQWPALLQRPEYAESMGLIESLLKTWGAEQYPIEGFARRALTTETSLLRKRVAEDRRLPSSERIAAVRTLKLVQHVAVMGLASEPATVIAAAW